MCRSQRQERLLVPFDACRVVRRSGGYIRIDRLARASLLAASADRA